MESWTNIDQSWTFDGKLDNGTPGNSKNLSRLTMSMVKALQKLLVS